MATRLNPSNFGYQNFYSSTLTGDITSGTLTIGLATVPTPTSGVLIIEPDSTSNREVIVYTSKGASTITCPSDGRGYSGTTPAAHLTGSTVIMAPVDKWFTALASGELSTDPMRTEHFQDYVASGMVWSGDSYASTRNASMSSGVMYINGRRLTASAVSAKSFTASKDTYVDASDNGDGTVLLTYTEVTNNAASPALAANSHRIAIVVTGASNIAAAGSINQGQDSKVLPISGGFAYAINDSLGNRICRRNATETRRGFGAVQPGLSVIPAAYTTYVSIPVILQGRSIEIEYGCNVKDGNSGATRTGHVRVFVDGATALGDLVWQTLSTGVYGGVASHIIPVELSAGLHTIALQISADTASASTLQSAYIRVIEP